jgi:hypothetical protein
MYKEIIKIRSRQHEHTSQCDGPAWLTSERGAVNSWFPFHWWSKPPHHVKVIHSGRHTFWINKLTTTSLFDTFTFPFCPLMVDFCFVLQHLLLFSPPISHSESGANFLLGAIKQKMACDKIFVNLLFVNEKKAASTNSMRPWKDLYHFRAQRANRPSPKKLSSLPLQ